MSYLMSGMYALPLCVPINRAYKVVEFGLIILDVCMEPDFSSLTFLGVEFLLHQSKLLKSCIYMLLEELSRSS